MLNRRFAKQTRTACSTNEALPPYLACRPDTPTSLQLQSSLASCLPPPPPLPSPFPNWNLRNTYIFGGRQNKMKKEKRRTLQKINKNARSIRPLLLWRVLCALEHRRTHRQTGTSVHISKQVQGVCSPSLALTQACCIL